MPMSQLPLIFPFQVMAWAWAVGAARTTIKIVAVLIAHGGTGRIEPIRGDADVPVAIDIPVPSDGLGLGCGSRENDDQRKQYAKVFHGLRELPTHGWLREQIGR